MKKFYLFVSLILLFNCNNIDSEFYEISKNELKDKIKGAWAAQTIGVTFGGPTEFRYLKRVIPDNLKADIDLNKIKTLKIFNWLKKKGISENEMLKTFNCGVGFCLIIKKKNLKKIQSYFPKDYKPYVIGKIINGKNKVKLNGSINWNK